MVEGESGGGEGVVVLGTRHRLRVVVLGARSRARVVVLGPRLLASLASCCRPRASVRHSLGSEGWGGKGGGRSEGWGASGGGGRAWWCGSLVTVHACWCWALVRSSVMFILCLLVVRGRVAGRLWLQVSSRWRCPHLRVVSCCIVVFMCRGWC